MGVKVLEDLVDFEIRPLINKLNNFSFIQTRSCCSGWSGLEQDVVSDGTNRKWVGNPYLSFWSLDDIEIFKFVSYIMKNMIFHYESRTALERIDEFKNTLKLVRLEDDKQQLLHVGLEYRDDKIVVNFYINDRDRKPEQVQKIFDLFLKLVEKYKN